MLIAVAIDRHSLHVLHGEPRRAVFRDASVDQRRDIRVGEPRENLAFVEKAPLHVWVGERRAGELEGHLVVKLIVVALRQVDRAHAAAADLTYDAKRAD